MDWIDGRVLFEEFTVEKHEIARSDDRPYVPHTSMDKLNFVLHTTEGGSVAGALATFEGEPNNASHFLIGENRIIQLRPVNAQAGALRVNSPHNPNDGAIQIENVGFSKETLWLPDDDVQKPLTALLAFLGNGLSIPLATPNQAWVDDCSDIKTILATNNTRRQEAAKTWPGPQGVWMHLLVSLQNAITMLTLRYLGSALRCYSYREMDSAFPELPNGRLNCLIHRPSISLLISSNFFETASTSSCVASSCSSTVSFLSSCFIACCLS